jgi:hypothetical protein
VEGLSHAQHSQRSIDIGCIPEIEPVAPHISLSIYMAAPAKLIVSRLSIPYSLSHTVRLSIPKSPIPSVSYPIRHAPYVHVRPFCKITFMNVESGQKVKFYPTFILPALQANSSTLWFCIITTRRVKHNWFPSSIIHGGRLVYNGGYILVLISCRCRHGQSIVFDAARGQVVQHGVVWHVQNAVVVLH